jgi:hypothetical protein
MDIALKVVDLQKADGEYMVCVFVFLHGFAFFCFFLYIDYIQVMDSAMKVVDLQKEDGACLCF